MYNSNFIFGGFKSQDMNLHIVSMTREDFVEIGVTRQDDNISFEVDLAYANNNNEPMKINGTTRRLIYSTLIKDEYVELQLDDYPEVIFYAKFIPISVNINAHGMGYFKFRIETNSKFAYGKYKEYEFTNDSSKEKEVLFSAYDNLNIDYIYPVITMELLDSGIEKAYIKTSLGEIGFDFTKCKDYEEIIVGEKILIDCETHTIEQTNSNEFVNRISIWNCNFIEVKNLDYLTVSPYTKIVIRYRLKIIV